MQFIPSVAAWSLDQPSGSCEHLWRNRQTDLLRGFEIDYQLELRRLFDWNVGWFKFMASGKSFAVAG